MPWFGLATGTSVRRRPYDSYYGNQRCLSPNCGHFPTTCVAILLPVNCYILRKQRIINVEWGKKTWGFHRSVSRFYDTSTCTAGGEHSLNTLIALLPSRYILLYVGVNGDGVRSATYLKAIPWASQHARLWIYRLSVVIDTIATPFKSEVWSGEASSLKRPK